MATISIASLSPRESPPADKSIRAIVSLLWPYSSSTKQCAWLLAEPDFRLRKDRGQIRVRFQGASAQAVAKGHVGIGDELVLELRGATWAGEASNVLTPGKSVDGELLFKGELAVRLVKKAHGEQIDVSIAVDETTPPIQPPPPPPEERETNTTPAPPIPSSLRSSLGGADVVPIYSSPAFVRRMRLSGGTTTSWDFLADVDREWESELAHPRKKQRISFGGVGKWKVAHGTPSPEKDDVPMATVVDAENQKTPGTVVAVQDDPTPLSDHEDEAHTKGQSKPQLHVLPNQQTVDAVATSTPAMAPPVLPQLEMPENPSPSDMSRAQQASSDLITGPHTPKLQPVPSSALPLPSPFPAEVKQLHTGGTSPAADPNERQGASRAAEAVSNRKDAEVIERSGHASLHTEASQDLLYAVDEHEDEDERHFHVLLGQPSYPSSIASTVPPEQASGVFQPSESDEYNDDMDNVHDDGYTRSHRAPDPKYGSDTEEDEEMYTQYTRQGDAEREQAARGDDALGSDEGNQVHADDVEEVIEDMGKPPDSEGSDEGASEGDSQLVESDDDDVESIDDHLPIEPSLIEVSSGPTGPPEDAQPSNQQEKEQERAMARVPGWSRTPAPLVTSARGDHTIKLSQVGDALSSTFDQQQNQTGEKPRAATQTPARPPAGLLSLDGAADSLRVRTSTLQSERDRIMKRTYSSLFGFAKSPSPEKSQPPLPDLGTPTPASSTSGFSRMAMDRFAAAGMSIDEIQLISRPGPARQKAEETQSQADTLIEATADTAPIEMLVPACTTIADTQTAEADATSCTISTRGKQMPVSARATIAETQSLTSRSSAMMSSVQAKQMPVPTRATAGLTQSSTQESSAPADILSKPRSEADTFTTSEGTISKCELKDDPADALVEPIAAIEETGQTSPLGDVADGSLLDTVHNAAPKIYEGEKKEKVLAERSSMIEETPIDRLQGSGSHKNVEQDRLEAEDSVPDGVAINPSLAAAMASEPRETTSADSAPRPSQVEVIDLGDSSDEEGEELAGTATVQETAAEPSQPIGPLSGSPSTRAPMNHAGASVGEARDAGAIDHQQDLERLLAQAEQPRNPGQESITQISQGSMLQSDMLDTTQTTVDGRSEIATPYMDEYDTIVPDTSHDGSVGVYQGQPNFFDGPMHGQDFEGNATQQTTTVLGDVYNQNLSFQSVTSVATDNSDRRQTNATQRERVMRPEEEETATQDNLPPNDSQMTVVGAGSYVDPDAQAPLLNPIELNETPQDQAIFENTAPERQAQPSEARSEQITHNVEMQDGQLPSSFTCGSPTQYQQRQPDLVPGSSFESSQSAPTPSEDLATDVRVLREAAQLAESRISHGEVATDRSSVYYEDLAPAADGSQQEDHHSSHRAGSHSTLPISVEDSQHRLESQPFETQLPFESAQSVLTPAPELTQRDSLAGQGLQVVVKSATETEDVSQPEEPPSTSPRQTRSNQRGALVEGVRSPEKKAPARRSPRKSQAQSHGSQQVVSHDESTTMLHKPITREPSLDRPITPPPPRTQRSQETAATKKSLQSPKTKTPVRRSPRKSQAENGSQDLTDSRSIAAPDDHGLSADRNSVGSIATAPVTRSSKKRAENTAKLHVAPHNMKDDVAVASPSLHVDYSPQPKTPPGRSMTSRISAVPAVISNWFSPRRSSRLESEPDPEVEAQLGAELEAQAKADNDEGQLKVSPNRRKSNGVVTQLSYYTPLSNISEKLNASSQSYGSNTVDVMAVVVDETSKPQQAKGGPRDHFTVFKITDPSMDAGASTTVEIFKHWRATLPSAQVGDVVLLRSFLVKSRKRQPYLLSGDESAWCVWRYAESEPGGTVPSSQKSTPTKMKRMRDRNGSFSIEIKGPPVEHNRPQELKRAEELRAGWLAAQGELNAGAGAVAGAAPASQVSIQMVGRKTRSQQKL